MPPEIRNVWENNLQMAKQFVVDILNEKIISLHFFSMGTKLKPSNLSMKQKFLKYFQNKGFFWFIRTLKSEIPQNSIHNSKLDISFKCWKVIFDYLVLFSLYKRLCINMAKIFLSFETFRSIRSKILTQMNSPNIKNESEYSHQVPFFKDK